VPQRGIDHLNGQSLTKVEACDRFPLIEANAISRPTTCRQGLRWRQGEIPVAVALIKIAHVKKISPHHKLWLTPCQAVARHPAWRD
jgi:hypothetical protein